MRTVNFWIATRGQATNLINERLDWDEQSQGEYKGAVPNWIRKLFSGAHDRVNVQKMFRVDRVWFSQGAVFRNWTLWNIYHDVRRKQIQDLIDEMDDLNLQYPGMIKIIGAWNMDGTQVNNGTNPVFPINERALEFLPDLVMLNSNGDEVSRSRPPSLVDVNLLFGQSPRQT